MTGYDDLSPRARWFLENFSEPDLAEMCANHEKPTDPGAHVYLSTGCLHGEHAYCQGKTGQAGAKKPAQCKFCDAPCVCDCHTATKETRP